ncbi:hypothetical protein [Parvibaculum sp.]|uniref:hypothetical protein n=1 Tax=Parvibaculum sp. TaxID=2024848 RepID=UPI003296E2AA
MNRFVEFIQAWFSSRIIPARSFSRLPCPPVRGATCHEFVAIGSHFDIANDSYLQYESPRVSNGTPNRIPAA